MIQLSGDTMKVNMLQLSTIYYDRPILSLRSGGPVGHALSPLINPNNLKIEGWYATAHGERTSFILPAQEVRDMIKKGIVVNDHTSLTHTEDLVRLKKVIEHGFEIIGKQVYSENNKKVGKISNYAVDEESMLIKKLYVSVGITKSFKIQQLIIDRSQIVEINDSYITVRDAAVQVPATKGATQTA
jgi:sporulation protein YlmC with PRC-barrel domain